MPFLRFHFTDTAKLAGVSDVMITRVEQILGCPREHIVLEAVRSVVVQNGVVEHGDWPMVEISWFERTRQEQAAVAAVVSECLRSVGYPDSDVYFSVLKKENYYENGKCCDIS